MGAIWTNSQYGDFRTVREVHFGHGNFRKNILMFPQASQFLGSWAPIVNFRQPRRILKKKSEIFPSIMAAIAVISTGPKGP